MADPAFAIPEHIALYLTEAIIRVEGLGPEGDKRQSPDKYREYLLSTYAECLKVVKGDNSSDVNDSLLKNRR